MKKVRFSPPLRLRVRSLRLRVRIRLRLPSELEPNPELNLPHVADGGHLSERRRGCRAGPVIVVHIDDIDAVEEIEALRHQLDAPAGDDDRPGKALLERAGSAR